MVGLEVEQGWEKLTWLPGGAEIYLTIMAISQTFEMHKFYDKSWVSGQLYYKTSHWTTIACGVWTICTTNRVNPEMDAAESEPINGDNRKFKTYFILSWYVFIPL